jgi:D-threo-aldose 1-dehydrogenase
LLPNISITAERYKNIIIGNVSLVIGSSLNAGFISGSPRYNYGKDSYKIPAAYIEKRKKLRDLPANYGVDLRTAALQFSAAPDVAALWWSVLAENVRSWKTTPQCRLRFQLSSGGT